MMRSNKKITIINPPLLKMYYQKYGAALNTDFTIECDDCGYTVPLDNPRIIIQCWECFEAEHKHDEKVETK